MSNCLSLGLRIVHHTRTYIQTDRELIIDSELIFFLFLFSPSFSSQRRSINLQRPKPPTIAPCLKKNHFKFPKIVYRAHRSIERACSPLALV